MLIACITKYIFFKFYGFRNSIYCYSGYQVFLINSIYLALLVMVTFIQVNTSSYRHAKNFNIRQLFEQLLSCSSSELINESTSEAI